MRRIGWAAAVAICIAIVAVQGANAAGPYQTESDFMLTTSAVDRSSFIIDELPVVNPPSFIPRSVFLSAPYLAYYENYGFDRNFFTWLDPTDSFTPDNKITWSGCQSVPAGQPTHQTKQFDGRLLCDPAFTIPDSDGTPIRESVATGQVHGFIFIDSGGVIHFVSTVCGNFTHGGPAPPPTITGLKFNDLDKNGVKGQLEPGLPGFTFDLYYMNQPVLQSGVQVTATTDASGHYTFTLDADTMTAGGQPIGPGEYEIKEEAKAGWTATTPQPLIVNVPIGSAGKNFQASDFGNFQVPAPKITTQLVPSTATVAVGTAVHDTAQLSGGTSDAGGTVIYTSYPSLADCLAGTNGTQVGQPVTVTAGVVPKSKAIKYQTAGTFYWQAVYSGDANNQGAKSDCGTEAITVAIPPGQLVICKAADNGALNQSFSFIVTDSGGVIHLASAVGGGCSTIVNVPPGTTKISEDLSSGLWLVSVISVSPIANLISSNPGAGSVTVNLNSSELTTVTVTNQQAPPSLEVCKWTTSSQLLGQVFNFTAGATALTAAAGPSHAQAGCSNPKSVTLGQTIKVTETVPNGVILKTIDVSSNATLVSITGPQAKVIIGPGLNIVYFQDEVPPPQNGFIEVCKDAADPFVPTLTPFTFTVTDKTGFTTTFPVYVGQCSTAIQVAAGLVTVSEAPSPPTMLANVTTVPPDALGTVNLANGTAQVLVPVSDTTSGEVLVHFLNTTQTATLKVCKLLTPSSSALSGQTFTFTVNDASGTSTIRIIAAPTGQCVIVPHPEPLGSVVTVTEAATPYADSGSGPNTPTTKTITIVPGISDLSFTNQAEGQLAICKNLSGSGGSGTFTFDYAGVSPANPTHGSVQVAAGTCSFSLVVPVDNYTITEESAPGFSFVSSSAAGPGGDNRRVSGTNPITVSVPYYGTAFPAGGETDVTFVNSVPSGTIKVCKMIDSNSSASIGGLSYTFKVFNPAPTGNVLLTSGSVTAPYPTTTNPTAFAPNACVLLGSYAFGSTLLVTEVQKSSYDVQKITLTGNATVNTNNPNKNGRINITVTGPGTIVIVYVNEATPAL